MKLVHAGQVSVGVYNIDGEYYAIEDRCSHDDGALVEGDWEPDGESSCARGTARDSTSGQARR